MPYTILSQIFIVETGTCIHHWQLDLKKNQGTDKWSLSQTALERKSEKKLIFLSCNSALSEGFNGL